MTDGISVRKCATLADFEACVALQREVWVEEDLEIEPVSGFIVATQTGGHVLGAFDGAKLVGYTLALVGYRDATIFLHSHHTGVHHDYRNRGVGRQLKLFQREEALSRDIRFVQWTFDPLELRNAHFNLNRLGAICRQYKPNLYGVTTSPLHRGMVTDRLLAEWHLDTKRVVAASENLVTAPDAISTAAAARIALPDQLEQWKLSDSASVLRTQDRIRSEFTEWFGRGYAVIGTQKTATGTDYLLVPWSDF